LRNDYKELQGQLNALAEWIEKYQNVHAASGPRIAADTIKKLEEENYQFRLLLNKRDETITEKVNKYIGYARFAIYKVRKKWKI